MVDFAGYDMPVLYTKKGALHTLGISQSVRWTRENASLFDVSHMCSLRWTGNDAIDFVESVTTADVHGFKPMQGGLSVIPNKNGGIIDDTMLAKCHSKQHGVHVYQVINAGCAPKDLKYFREQLKNFDGDVKMDVLWDDRGLYALQGPKAKDVVSRLCPSVDVGAVSFGEMFWAPIAGVECLVWRCGYTGEDGFEIFVPAAGAREAWQLLKDQPEVRLAALGARDVLRLEAGLCLYGQDIDESTTPGEAGISWVVAKQRRRKKSKNKFPGYSKIVNQARRPKKLVQKLRVGMKFLNKGPPARTGALIENEKGDQVGVVTSGTRSVILGENIFIAYLDKPYHRKGTPLNVKIRRRKFPVQRTKLPFVPTQYYRA